MKHSTPHTTTELEFAVVAIFNPGYSWFPGIERCERPLEVVLVSICVNVLAAAGCVKFSEVFTVNTESVLNLRTGDRAVVYCTRDMYALCDERCSVQCTCCNVEVLCVHGDDCHSSVSSRHVCYGQCTCTCTWCLLYKFFLQVDALRTVSTRQNKERLTGQWHPCSVNNWVHVHLYLMLFFGDYCAKQFFCRLAVCRLFLRIRTGNPWQNQMSVTLVYYR